MDKIDVIDKMFEKWVAENELALACEFGNCEYSGKAKQEDLAKFRSDFIEAVKAVLPKKMDTEWDFNCGFNSCLDTIHKNLEGMK